MLYRISVMGGYSAEFASMKEAEEAANQLAAAFTKATPGQEEAVVWNVDTEES